MDREKKGSHGKKAPPGPTRKSEQAIVRCEGFRCMAYKDGEGVWRSVADDKELKVIEVVLRF